MAHRFVIKTDAIFAGRDDSEYIPLFIVECDFDAYDGQGAVMFSNAPGRAKHFDTFAEAFEYWRGISKVRPIRTDGKPNRPLTAFTVEILTIEDEPRTAPQSS